MAQVHVETVSTDDPMSFTVTIEEGDERTEHRVTLQHDDYTRLAPGEHGPEKVVEAAFGFLLDREPKEQILSSFDLPVIERYFPEFQEELPKYLE